MRRVLISLLKLLCCPGYGFYFLSRLGWKFRLAGLVARILCLLSVYLVVAGFALVPEVVFRLLHKFWLVFGGRYLGEWRGVLEMYGPGVLVYYFNPFFVFGKFVLELGQNLFRNGVSRFGMEWARSRVGPDEGILVGISKRTYRAVVMSFSRRTEHVFIVGSTGTGKTTGFLEPAMKADIDQGRGLVFLTAKEDLELLSRIFTYVSLSGRNADLRIFSFGNGYTRFSYNPFYFDGKMLSPMALVDLCMQSFTWDNAYYRDQSKMALSDVFEAFSMSGRYFTMEDLYLVIQHRQCMEYLRGLVMDTMVRAALDAYVTNWKVFSHDMKGLVANLREYTGKNLRAVTCPEFPAIDLSRVYQDNQIVLVVLDSLQFGEKARVLGRLFLQNIKLLAGHITERGFKKFFPVYLDEFHHFVYGEFFSMVALCRSAGIGVTLATQSFADLKKDGFDLKDQIVQNTNTKIILRQNDPESSEYAARLTGTRTAVKYTDQVEDGVFKSRSKTGVGTLRDVEEFNVHPNEIRKLKTFQAAYIERGYSDVVDLAHLKLRRQYSDIRSYKSQSLLKGHDLRPLDMRGYYGERLGKMDVDNGIQIERRFTGKIEKKAKIKNEYVDDNLTRNKAGPTL